MRSHSQEEETHGTWWRLSSPIKIHTQNTRSVGSNYLFQQKKMARFCPTKSSKKNCSTRRQKFEIFHWNRRLKVLARFNWEQRGERMRSLRSVDCGGDRLCRRRRPFCLRVTWAGDVTRSLAPPLRPEFWLRGGAWPGGSGRWLGTDPTRAELEQIRRRIHLSEAFKELTNWMKLTAESVTVPAAENFKLSFEFESCKNGRHSYRFVNLVRYSAMRPMHLLINC